ATPDLMVGFPRPLQTLHWTNVWSDVWSEVKELVPESVVFGDSHVTRPIFFEMFREEGVDLWRRVWADKKVTVVAGEGGRFSLVDPLFASASDIVIAWSVPV